MATTWWGICRAEDSLSHRRQEVVERPAQLHYPVLAEEPLARQAPVVGVDHEGAVARAGLETVLR